MNIKFSDKRFMFIGSPKQLLITLINTISKVSNHLLISTYPTKKLNNVRVLKALPSKLRA